MSDDLREEDIRRLVVNATSTFRLFEVVRFRARQSSQEVPFAVLSAFKHHMENISRIGEMITRLRKSLVWIEEHELELDRISDIFQWGGGLVVLANDLRMQHESVQMTIREMDRLGAITYRLPCEGDTNDKPCIFKAKAIVGVNQPELGCVIENGRMYTVVHRRDPFLWKLAETGQEIPSIFLEPSFSGPEERLCEKVQTNLDSFKAACLRRTCQTLLRRLKETKPPTETRWALHFPRTPTPPKPRNDSAAQLPQHLRDSLIRWIEQFGKEDISWEPVDGFWQWYQSLTARGTYLTETIQIGLRFIEALFQMENSSVAEYFEESGFNETELSPPSQMSTEGLNSSFKWKAKLEAITNTEQEFTWKGNLHKLDAPMCVKDPRTVDMPAAAAMAKNFTSKFIQ